VSIITGNQLALIQKVFEIAGSQISAVTELDDANISQVVTINELVRRATIDQVPCGWWQGVLENVHSGADTELSFIDPYAAGPDANAPFPAVVPDSFDIWLCGVSGARSSGVGGLTSAVASINPAGSTQAWGRDDSGAPLGAIGPRMVMAVFDNIVDTSLSQDPMETQQGKTVRESRGPNPEGLNSGIP